eukprot:TRINITY_DN14383_c0_g1_i2.p2 TRINITY_DN14383_c0_g1~~TRINITY_DN14383_c0_g1_i2.p2  ORF type:complete len:112 (+),score=13.79 TRINITY_DN14383_c0_g1_i2:66-401(+)
MPEKNSRTDPGASKKKGSPAKKTATPAAHTHAHTQRPALPRYGWKGRMQFLISFALFMCVAKYMIDGMRREDLLGVFGLNEWYDGWVKENRAWLEELYKAHGHSNGYKFRV